MPESDLNTMLRTMNPVLKPGRFVFVGLDDLDLATVELHATVREDEGLSAVILRDDADSHGFEYDFVAVWITLRVESALSAVGLTAAVSACLTEQAISCNVIAGLRHDHLLVPEERRYEAIDVLSALSASAAE